MASEDPVENLTESQKRSRQLILFLVSNGMTPSLGLEQMLNALCTLIAATLSHHVYLKNIFDCMENIVKIKMSTYVPVSTINNQEKTDEQEEKK